MSDIAQKPLFRADQVGSLLRPSCLLEARARFAAGVIDAQELRKIEDASIAQVVREQEELGLQLVTDGEYRRENWWIDFISKIGGVEIREGDNDAFQNSGGHVWNYVPKDVVTTRKIFAENPIYQEDFAFLAKSTRVTPKITIPSPTRMHFHGGRRNVDATAYPDMEMFFADVAALYQREITALEDAGCRYIQIDDPLLTYFISDRLRTSLEKQGDDPDTLLLRYVALVNACIAKRRPSTRIGIHLCRGNSRSSWISEGGYERIAATIFENLHVDSYYLEYDDERSGDFHPLRFVPNDKVVVLGLVTTKRGDLERADDLKRRIDEASAYVPIERLALSPQCGFASVVEGNIITPDDQRRKLSLIVEVARAVWGAA